MREERKINWTYVVVCAVVYMFMLGAALISFSHIVKVSGMLGLTWEKWTVPFFIDGLAVLGLIGRSRRFEESTRSAGLKLTIGMGVLSLACNVMAGTNLGQKLYGALVVTGFVVAEWYSAKLAPAPVAAQKSARSLDPQTAKERAAKAKATREKNRWDALTPAQKAAETRRRNADVPVSPAGPLVPTVGQLEAIAGQ